MPYEGMAPGPPGSTPDTKSIKNQCQENYFVAMFKTASKV